MTDRTDRKIDGDALMRPFEGPQVRQRAGPGRKPIDYISGPDVIRRLLDATGNQFTWNVERVQLVTQETSNGPVSLWMVLGTLSVGDLGSRSGVGTHSADSVEAAKAAETDALKRAAIKFGVGLHLYEEDANQSPSASPRPPQTGERNNNSNGTYPRPAPQPQPVPPPRASNSNGYGNGNGGNGGNGYAGARRSTASINGVGENAPF